MKWKDLSLKERKQIYDSVRVNNPGATYFDIKEQFDSIPAYEDGGKSIVDEVNKSDANFVQRLKSPTRQTIPNWEDQYRVLPWEKSVSTHKLSVWDNANGGGIIVPDVQEVNGKLIDFTRPPYNNRAAVENALKTEINDRINALVMLMAQGRFFYVGKECASLVTALCTAVWDPNEITKNVRLDDGTSDIDSLDSFEYTFERSISMLIRCS